MAPHLLQLGVGPGPAGGPTTLLSDTFTDANGTALAAHVMDVGPGWTAVNGTATIQNNKAQAATGNAHYTSDSGKSDVTVAGVLNLPAGAGANDGLVARGSDGNNYWRLTINAGASMFKLTEVVAGALADRASTSVTVTTGTDYTLSLQCSGQTMTGTLNGGNSISYGSAASNQTVTKHGIRSPDAGTTTDNFLVTNP